MTSPVLLAVSHGTASPEGQRAIEALVAAVAARLDDADVRLAHVDVQEPGLEQALAEVPTGVPVVIVPLLLGAGFHVHVDIADAAAARPGTTVARALGPDDRLALVLADRLAELPEIPADVVLASAGSTDARANGAAAETARLLSLRLDTRVRVAYLAHARPGIEESIEGLDSGAIASYLLSPGYFHSLTISRAGQLPVTRPLLDGRPPHPALVGLVIDRFLDAR